MSSTEAVNEDAERDNATIIEQLREKSTETETRGLILLSLPSNNIDRRKAVERVVLRNGWMGGRRDRRVLNSRVRMGGWVSCKS